MWQRFTERARRVVFFAQEEAQREHQSYVDTEHFLLGLVRESDSVAARILDRLDIPLGRIRREVEHQLTPGDRPIGEEMQLTPGCKQVIDLAYEEARGLNNNYIGTEHLLLGLVHERVGLAGRVLIKLGADLERVRAEAKKMQDGEAPTKTGASQPPESAWRHLWDMPYTELRKLAEYAKSDRNPAGAASAAMVAVDLARSNCTALRDFRGIFDLSADQAWALLSLARVLKDTLGLNKTAHREILTGKTLAMLFEKPSLRTRVSFETGMFQLGGHAVYLPPADVGMGQREAVEDVARILERMVDGITARVFAQQTLTDLSDHANIPVINALSDREHPCQALADVLTLWERRGEVEGQKIAYIGDGNNVAHSLMQLGAKLGAHVMIACPQGYEPAAEIRSQAELSAQQSRGSVTITSDPKDACADADVVYTDVWASMGQEAEAAERAKIFAPYQVNEELLAVAKPDYLFMHCLPAHRGAEVTATIIDGPHSVVFDQAENRLHAQKAILAVLLG